jgi:uncharacterized membrane protein (UPF0182 family)
MRSPQDLPRRIPRTSRRTRIALVVVVVALVILIASLKALANFWIDYLWFSSVHLTSVFRGVLLTKVVLSVVFIAIFFVLVLVNLTVADRLAPTEVDPATANELVLRYRGFAEGRNRLIRLVVSAVFAVLGGIGADREWNNWDLFHYRVSFGISDPQFHRDVGFYVFELPFIRFLITWAFEAVVVTLLITAVASYLNGGIAPQVAGERVRPAVKAHLSVLLALLAFIKAVSYYYDRLALVLSRAHVVDGATATSVHADAPAKFLLIVIAILSGLLFLANLRQRGWVLPAVGVALWFLVSVLVGAAYPALYQALRVQPSELTREAPYISRNIIATRAAYGLNQVKEASGYQYSPTVSTSDIQGNSSEAALNQQTIANVRLLDPNVNLLATFNKFQALRQYYSFNNLFQDRYDLTLNGSTQETATVTSVRELNGNVPSGFVNQHLEYTHGYGAVQAPVSEYGVAAGGNPTFTLQNVPPTSSQPATQLDATTDGAVTGPDVYYGEGPDTGGFVVADSKTPELDYEQDNGTQVTNHYNGSGGVPAGSLIRRAAFALRFGDANFVLSGQITPSSRVMFYRDINEEVSKAAPFLKFDSDPYAVILNGGIYWVVDGYTTTNNYPYSQEADINGLPVNSGLNTGFNYVRNSVKVVISAYTGQMTFFDMGTGDPILSVYERAFPGLFVPVSQADRLYPGITAHWRYPEDLFLVQSNMFGRYHLTNVSEFYTQAQSWEVSPDPGSGPLSNTAIGTEVIGPNGQTETIVKPLAPQYIEAALPNTGQQTVNFSLITPFVPYSPSGTSQNLTAFMTASSDPGTYGQLTLYLMPPNETVDGPPLIASAIRANSAISQELTYYNQPNGGSQVELGEVDVVPLGQSLLYIEPVYVESDAGGFPLLDDVVVVYNNKAYHSSNASLDNALCQIQNPDGSRPFSAYCNTPLANESSNLATTPGATTPTTPGSTTTTTTPTTFPTRPPSGASVAALIAAANQDLASAQAALAQGNLGAYQADVNAAHAAITQALSLENSSSSSSSTTTAPAPSTSPSSSPATTTTQPAAASSSSTGGSSTGGSSTGGSSTGGSFTGGSSTGVSGSPAAAGDTPAGTPAVTTGPSG